MEGLFVLLLLFMIYRLLERRERREHGGAQLSKAEEQRVLEELARDIRHRRDQQSKLLEELTRYPDESATREACRLFVGVGEDSRRELCWMVTDKAGCHISDHRGEPSASTFAAFSADAKRVGMLVVHGRHKLDGLSLPEVLVVDIQKGNQELGKLFGGLCLNDEDAPLQGIDSSEAQMLLTYRCFMCQ